jgi:hypothetical protein
MAYEFSLTGTRRGPKREAMDPFTAKLAMAPSFVMNDYEKCDDPVPVVTRPEAAAQAAASGVEPGSPELVTDVARFLRVLLPGYDR